MRSGRPVEERVEEHLAEARAVGRSGVLLHCHGRDAQAPCASRALGEASEQLDEDGTEIGRGSRSGLGGRVAAECESQGRRAIGRWLEPVELGSRKRGRDGGLDRPGQLAWRIDLPARPAADPANIEAQTWPAARPSRHAAPSSRMEGRDEASGGFPVSRRAGIKSQRPALPVALGRAVIRSLAEAAHDRWTDRQRGPHDETHEAHRDDDRDDAQQRTRHDLRHGEPPGLPPDGRTTRGSIGWPETKIPRWR